jgi:Zn-dependent M28 family amino/carboxypeptidase
MGAAASISLQEYSRSERTAGVDFTTVQRLDSPVPPEIGVNDEFFDFLFSGSEHSYADLKARIARGEDLPTFTLKNVKLTFNLDADYQVITTQYTRNVVARIEGSDPQLKNTYVAFGAHYDHIGYITGSLPTSADRINNGADDDGSGTSTLIGIARQFALSSVRTKRSLLFVWHAGEEKGLYGSKYFADNPVVPISSIVTQLNIDMIGRNRDNKESESNTVYAIGADRISTELHNILVDANQSLQPPLKVDFEMNSPTDPERLYYRSDHYSYASKGVPVIFFFTGLHPDYHQVTDSVEKIHFDKMAHIGQLVYEIGRRVADLDHAPARDFKGARAGKGSIGRLSD